MEPQGGRGVVLPVVVTQEVDGASRVGGDLSEKEGSLGAEGRAK